MDAHRRSAANTREIRSVGVAVDAYAIWCSFGKAWYGNKVRGNILAMVM
jgi:hypothetical protein